MIDKSLPPIKRLEQFWDLYIGWFFVNGRKQDQYFIKIKNKWNL